MDQENELAEGYVDDLLARVQEAPSFALLRRQASDNVDVLFGSAEKLSRLADIPLEGEEVLALVPYRQIRERGFAAIDDGAPILSLTVQEKAQVGAERLAAALPAELPELEDIGFDLDDEAYADAVARIITDEIGTGVGANFVIRRDYRAKTGADPAAAGLAWFRRLLELETGAYWTFLVVTPGLVAVGASPERHVSASAGTVLMNPISGTLRHGARQPTPAEILTFLADRKESEELVMVVDEELKMMSSACPGGGVMHGPYLKPMSKVTHTEYLLEGTSSLDPRETLRRTMFAPTVVGSPMGSACEVIAEYEPSGRGYYSGVLARFTPQEHGYDLDAPILIRTAFLTPEGDLTVSAGATLVATSDPLSEAAETRAKVSGMLTALGLRSAEAPRGETGGAGAGRENPAVTDPEVLAALADRNRLLAPFWRDAQLPPARLRGSALVIDGDDGFTAMLAHQLRRLGVDAEVVEWADVEDVTEPELVVFGPGPGSPLDEGNPRLEALKQLLAARLRSGRPLLATGLAHQLLAQLAGLPVERLREPRQGTPLMVRVGGVDALLGYYNTYTALGADGSVTPELGLLVESEPETGYVHALSGPGVVSVQGHLESVLSFDGFATLERLVETVGGTTTAER